MMKNNLSRRDALRAIGGLPLLLATGAAAGNKDDFTGALTQEPRLLGFATARAEELASPMTALSGRLPPELLGVLWRNGPAEHERFGHRYGHWFDGDGMGSASGRRDRLQCRSWSASRFAADCSWGSTADAASTGSRKPFRASDSCNPAPIIPVASLYNEALTAYWPTPAQLSRR